MKLTVKEFKRMIREEFLRLNEVSIDAVVDDAGIDMDEAEYNPWAVCTSSVGRKKKKKYEHCVKHVKKQQSMK